MKKKETKDKIEQPSLTEEQIQLFSAHIESNGEDRSQIEPFDQSVRAKTLRYAKKNKISTVAIITIIVSIVLVLSLLLSFVITSILNKPNKDEFKLIINDKTYTLKYSNVMINDIFYFDMNMFASLDEIQISGDANSRKYTLPNLQYLRFYADSDIAIVDGIYMQMESKAIFKDNTCIIPYKFLLSVIASGIKTTVDANKNIININRIKIGEDQNNNPVYEPITISNQNGNVSDIAYRDYGINFFELKKWLDPVGTDEYLILVNHDNPLPKTYVPTDLVQLQCDTNPANSDPSYYSLRTVAEKAVTAMMIAIENSYIDGLQVSSSYRSYARQEFLLEDYIQSKIKSSGLSYEAAKKEVQKTLAMPGHSEHQTGLSVDFVQGTKSLTTKFEKTSAFAWLKNNAHKFGFILRYPSDKTEITGYDYEPWHFRFVGITVASRIYEADICYEEYIALTKQN